jgi:hypothetical protein
MRLNGTSIYSSIKLNEQKHVPNEVQILRVGKFNHPEYGAFEITTQTLSEMKANFDANIRGIDMSFDYFHDSHKEAAAWVQKLELREGGTELWALVDWTPKAQTKLSERELRYFSPDFAFKYIDPEGGQTYANVLFGGGLTNRPFVKEMKAIVATENIKGLNMTDLEKAQKEVADLKAANLKLSEDMKAVEQKMASMPPAPPVDKVKELEAKIAALQAELEKAKGENEVMAAEKKKADEAKMLAEKTNAFNVLLSEGKACAAQKDAFLKGDMSEFVKLAQPINLKPSGSSESVTNTDDDTKAIIKLAEEKQKTNPKLSYGDAVSLAKKELKK